MRYAQSFEIKAPPETVWSVMADLERWPEWASSFKRLEFPDDRALRRGLRVRLTVRGAPTSEWVVTECEEGRRFAWETTVRGVHSLGDHVIEPVLGGETKVTLSMEYEGFNAKLFALMLRYVSNRNIALEGSGLKARAEALVSAH